MRKIILTTSIFLSTSLWASPMDKVCFIYHSPSSDENITAENYEHIRKNCERNNILRVMYINRFDVHYLTSSYCRADRNVNVIEAGYKDKYFLDCVLYSNENRENIPSIAN